MISFPGVGIEPAILDSLVWNRGRLLEDLLRDAQTIEVDQDIDDLELPPTR